MVTDHFGANEQLIQQFPKLKCITNFGVGFDAVAVDYASKKGIQVTNTPDVLTDDVADLAIGLLFRRPGVLGHLRGLLQARVRGQLPLASIATAFEAMMQ